MEQQCGRSMSNHSVGRLLQRLGYVRRRGRIKILPLPEARKARIRRFLIEMNDALAQESGRKLETVWEKIRKGWYGDPACSWQEGGWKAADCRKLVGHAINEMDKWVENDSVLRGSMGNIQIPDRYDEDSVCNKVLLYADGVGAEIEADSEAEMSTVDSDDEEL